MPFEKRKQPNNNMIGDIKTFSQIDIGQRFHLNGVGYVKHTTRSAKVLATGAVVPISQRQDVSPFNVSFFL